MTDQDKKKITKDEYIKKMIEFGKKLLEEKKESDIKK